MCGEHYGDSDFVNELEGSSPHVRGARFIKSATQDAVGIIPACAGSTVEQLFLTTVIGDHPRMCGEHTDLGKIVRVQWGSSPHVRGAPYRPAVFRHRAGIIPACAGSTKGSMTVKSTLRDHPRMCGEHDPPCWSLHVFQGSSPHVRGAPKGRSGSKDGTGIIPACAGSTP